MDVTQLLQDFFLKTFKQISPSVTPALWTSLSDEQFVSLSWDKRYYLYIYPLLRKLICMFCVLGKKVTLRLSFCKCSLSF